MFSTLHHQLPYRNHLPIGNVPEWQIDYWRSVLEKAGIKMNHTIDSHVQVVNPNSCWNGEKGTVKRGDPENPSRYFVELKSEPEQEIPFKGTELKNIEHPRQGDGC